MSANQESATASNAPLTAEKRSVLLDLAARCEATTRPDRELDRAIQLAVRKPQPSDRWTHDDERLPQKPRHYTASLDAAMTLLPEGALFDVGHFGDEKPGVFLASVMPAKGKTQSAEAATPALALCAAALRARSPEGDGQVYCPACGLTTCICEEAQVR